jgi:hypothetical protein
MSKEKTGKAGHTPPETDAMPAPDIENLISRIESEMQGFINIEGVDTDLTGRYRQRLISLRVRNNGFIDKAFDIAHDNPEFLPPHFDINILYENERRFEQLRQLMLVLQQFLQLATNALINRVVEQVYYKKRRLFHFNRNNTNILVVISNSPIGNTVELLALVSA